ncbi:MAG: PAS domain S-box protein [Bryobacteraceae bacterium]
MQIFGWLFDTRFMAHVYCYRRNPGLVGLHFISDLSIGAAYIAISLTLVYLVRRAKNEIPFSWMFLCFGVFIIACGGTHLMEVWTLWTPVYWFSGMIKAVTALASVTTAFALPPLVPKSLQMLRSAGLSEQRRMTIEETNEILKREIDERKRAESEIRNLNAVLEGRVQERTEELAHANRSLAELAAIVQHSHDAIYSIGLDGSLTSWNPAAERIFGFARSEIVGTSSAKIVPADYQREFAGLLDRIRRGEEIQPFETKRLHKDGRELDVSISISPLKDQAGELIGASVITRDITERKRQQAAFEETQKLESLGLIAGGVAHDFNNLLVGIMGNASLALDSLPDNDGNRELMEQVVNASERAAHLTNQLLAYAGKGRFVEEATDLGRLASDILALIRSSVPKHVHVRLDAAPDLPAIHGDPGQVQQLIMNLVINAAEAIPEERLGTVSVRTRVQEVSAHGLANCIWGDQLRPGTYVVLEVEDNGSGISPDLIGRIFDPFFTTKFTGRGLGLAAAHGIVRSHHGAIQVDSLPGRGSTFRVLFPAAPGVAAEVEAFEHEDLTGTGTILVIDDEEVVRSTASRTLEHLGYTVMTARNGEEGLDLLRKHAGSISLVLLDMTMPELSGEETFRQLRLQNPDVTVLLSSGYSEVEAARRFPSKDIAGFVQKPYTATRLGRIVREVQFRNRGRLTL